MHNRGHNPGTVPDVHNRETSVTWTRHMTITGNKSECVDSRLGSDSHYVQNNFRKNEVIFWRIVHDHLLNMLVMMYNYLNAISVQFGKGMTLVIDVVKLNTSFSCLLSTKQRNYLGRDVGSLAGLNMLNRIIR